MNILELNRVDKRFGSREVLKGLSFSVPEHTIYGFIGENGAGKTTTMKLILGLLPLDGGEIRVCGEPVRYGQTKTNRHIGYLPDVPEFYGYLTPVEYLTLCGSIAGMQPEELKNRTAELLSLVGLEQSAARRINGFSRGMKQRLGIAQALIHRPKLLVCDEPTSALDPAGRKDVIDVLKAIKHQTRCCPPRYPLDVERICDEIGLLHNAPCGWKASWKRFASCTQAAATQSSFKARRTRTFSRRAPRWRARFRHAAADSAGTQQEMSRAMALSPAWASARSKLNSANLRWVAVSGGGRLMKQIGTLLKKEFTELFRTGKATVLLIVFVIFGVMNPALAKLTPWMLSLMSSSLADAGITIGNITVDAMTAWTQYFKNLFMEYILVLALFCGTLTNECQSGTLVNLLAKGLPRWKVIATKFLSLLAVWSVCYWLTFAVTFGYSAYFWITPLPGIWGLHRSALTCWRMAARTDSDVFRVPPLRHVCAARSGAVYGVSPRSARSRANEISARTATTARSACSPARCRRGRFSRCQL